MRYIFSVTILLLGFHLLQSQTLLQTKNGVIEFFSKTPVEDIYAKNSETSALLNPSTGETAFSLSVNAFKFENKLMEEHFNENYLESEKYPKSTFSGKIDNIQNINFSKDGKYSSTVSGKLTMHGVTKDVSSPVTFEVYQGKVLARADFKVALVDYKIKVPKLVVNNIAEVIEIHVATSFEPNNK